MELTKKERKVIQRVTRPSTPKVMLGCVCGLGACGIAFVGCAVGGLYQLRKMQSAPTTEAETIKVMYQGLLALALAFASSFLAIFAWAARRDGILIAKLHGNIVEEKPNKITGANHGQR